MSGNMSAAATALASAPVHHHAHRGYARAPFMTALHCQNQRWERESRPCAGSGESAATITTSAPAPRTGAGSSPSQTLVQLLWYKRDLRLDDHPGWQHSLEAGADGSAAAPLPVFVFDPLRYAPLVLPVGGAEGERSTAAHAAVCIHRAVSGMHPTTFLMPTATRRNRIPCSPVRCAGFPRSLATPAGQQWPRGPRGPLGAGSTGAGSRAGWRRRRRCFNCCRAGGGGRWESERRCMSACMSTWVAFPGCLNESVPESDALHSILFIQSGARELRQSPLRCRRESTCDCGALRCCTPITPTTMPSCASASLA